MATKVPDFKVEKTGFWVCKMWPELECSPDGLVTDPSETQKHGLLEIKCLKIFRKIAPSDLFKSLEKNQTFVITRGSRELTPPSILQKPQKMARLTIFLSIVFLILCLINTTRQDDDCPRGSMHCVRSSGTVLRCGKGVQCVRIRAPITHVTCGSTFTRLIVDPGHHISTSGCQIRMIDDVIDKKEPEVKWYSVVHEDNHKHHNEHLPTTANCEESILGMLLIFLPALRPIKKLFEDPSYLIFGSNLRATCHSHSMMDKGFESLRIRKLTKKAAVEFEATNDGFVTDLHGKWTTIKNVISSFSSSITTVEYIENIEKDISKLYAELCSTSSSYMLFLTNRGQHSIIS
ncbi:unnamed protein product [Mytilus edulis]|uniref:YqaJ viral recombinase domain-containing protein n=1 Tax=Mytilus edulis TaxID=6550 RepID=A0A8S3TLV7_MYTED|nr:unnamed protein product [Mytilus edulis]